MGTSISVLIFFVVLPLLFIVFIAYSIRTKRAAANQLFQQGIGYIKKMRELLAAIQQHRGLTTGFINGNKDSKNQIETLGKRIATIFTEINAQGHWLNENSKWLSLGDHWNRLSLAYLQGDSENNFKQHNVIIANLLYLIEDVADVHHLCKAGGGTLDTDWRYLLSIAEYIGQARALGTGVAARGVCSSVLRIQLNHLRNKISGAIAGPWPENSKREIAELLVCIEQQLIVDVPSISAADYFKLATRCIDHVLEQFDTQVEQLSFFRR